MIIISAKRIVINKLIVIRYMTIKLCMNFTLSPKILKFFKNTFFIINISNMLINMKRLTKIKKIPIRKALFAGRLNLSLRSTNDESKYTSNNNVIKIKIYF